MIKKINTLFVTMFGLGKIKIIPGTFGSLATIIILYILFHILNISSNFILLGLIVISIYSFSAIASYIEKNDNKDPKEIVIDELIGQSIPICLYEVAHKKSTEINEILITYSIIFILFRIFDITKPYPVSYYDKNFKNSFGVVMDDVCAGLYVVAVLVLYMVFSS